MIDVLRDPLRFRIRVIASNIEARFDRALTGCFLEDFPEPESACLWDKVYRKVIATGEPHSFVGDVREDGADRQVVFAPRSRLDVAQYLRTER